MIDWINLAFNSLWILALAIGLASLSYASWEASVQQVKLRQRLAAPGYQALLNLAGLLFCLGLAGTSQAWWERALWLLLAVMFGLQSAGSLRELAKK